MAPQPGMFLREQRQCDAIRQKMYADSVYEQGYTHCLQRVLSLARKYPDLKYVVGRLKEEYETNSR